MTAAAAVRTSRTEAGERWEENACAHLERHGLTILERRYRCKLGELDVVCSDGPELVIVEVRARAQGAYVHALASIDRRKRLRIVRATQHLLMLRPHWRRRALRFDVVAIDGIDTAAPTITWIKNAFDAG